LDTDVIWLALAFVLVIEGLFPFISPATWRQTFQRLCQLPDVQIRFVGLFCILFGLMLMWGLS
jgi:uncharacterized protein YjeT (DUF2065 family)